MVEVVDLASISGQRVETRPWVGLILDRALQAANEVSRYAQLLWDFSPNGVLWERRRAMCKAMVCLSQSLKVQTGAIAMWRKVLSACWGCKLNVLEHSIPHSLSLAACSFTYLLQRALKYSKNYPYSHN